MMRVIIGQFHILMLGQIIPKNTKKLLGNMEIVIMHTRIIAITKNNGGHGIVSTNIIRDKHYSREDVNYYDKEEKHIDVPLYRHGVVWWLLVGWWWRPCVYLFWLFFNMIFNTEIRFNKQR